MRSLIESRTSAAVSIALCAALSLASRGAVAQGEFEDWNLESSVGQAHLVMVARVASISRLTVIEGAKTDVALREYRFEPVRRLKGIFQRDQLSMTGADLGISTGEGSAGPPLEEGEYRLLILVQQQGMRSMGCVSAAPGATTFNERVPLLTGPDDPLMAVVDTLIQVADSRSRRERATLLVDRLADASGLAAVPILSSLQLRGDLASTNPRAYAPLARLANAPETAVRLGALAVLREMLATGIKPDHPEHLHRVAGALRQILESDETVTRLRVTSLETLGYLLALKVESDWPRELLIGQMARAATHAERTAAATALARLADPQAHAAVLTALDELPLDEPEAGETAWVRAAVQNDASAAEKTLLSRLERSIAARQPLEAEVLTLGRMRSQASLPLLQTAAGQLNLAPIDRQRVAWALGRLRSDQAAPVLAGWLRGDDFRLKEASLAALETLDSPAAAREARPLLRTEAYLPFKLRLARLLARHGMADGYALATEHLADAEHAAGAALALAALEDPRTTSDLSAILADRPDQRWRAAALTGLAGIGDAAARKELLDILADDRHPLAANAAEAAGLTNDVDLLIPLAKLVRSRNRPIAQASLAALRRFLSGVRTSPRGLAAAEDLFAESEQGAFPTPNAEVSEVMRSAIADAVASLAIDAYVDADMRREALIISRLLGGASYAELLSALADQGELEGSPLLADVKAAQWSSRRAMQQP